MKASIVLCTRHPDVPDFDDASTGMEFASFEEARAVFDAPNPVRALASAMGLVGADQARFIAYYGDTPYVWLDGVAGRDGAAVVRQLRPERKHGADAAWAREQAMQAGMAFGCDGYNDAMGW